MRLLSRRRMIGLLAISTVVVLNACGEGESAERATTTEPEGLARSAATGREQLQHQILTEADAGKVIEVGTFVYDIGLPDKKGLEIHLSGDDDSAFRWRFAKKPDPSILEWHAVDGQLAFETDGLVGDPTTAAKVVEFRGATAGETAVVLELVNREPDLGSAEPSKRLEYTFSVRYEDHNPLKGPCIAGVQMCESF